MRFHKMHGCGNDFVLVDCFLEDVDDPSATAVQVCDRHIGVGADGLLLVEPPSDLGSEHAAGMRIFNPDGSEAEMCGNGIRCIAAYLCDAGRCASSDRVLIETAAGTRRVVVKDEGHGGERLFGVEMGVPVFLDLAGSGDGAAYRTGEGEISLALEDRTISGTAVSMGNPHFVVFVDDLESCPVREHGPVIEKHPSFPHGTNVEFIKVLDRHTLSQRTWERGVGETIACGTGAAAAAAAAVRRSAVKSPVRISLRGGSLTVRWDGKNGPLWLSGEALEVFRGELR